MKHNIEDHGQKPIDFSEEKSLEERVELLEEAINQISEILVELCRIQSDTNDPISSSRLLRLQVHASNIEVSRHKS